MAKITLREPNGPYTCKIDTEVMQVKLEDVFLGVSFVTKEGETLSVSMRDNGFETIYCTKFGETRVNTSFQNGIVISK